MSSQPSAPFFWFISIASALTLISAAPATAARSNSTFPEIVRISYVQGNVLLSKGNPKELDLTKPWEVAAVNVPIEKGFILATTEGRAEIEFESLTTVYLAENSTLYFQSLEVVNGIPSTRLQLVTGTVTVAARTIPGESFTIQGSATSVDFPRHSLTRVDNYLDATSVSPEGSKGENFQQSGSPIVHLVQGQTVVYQENKPVQIRQPALPNSLEEWDAWVLARVKTEHAAIDSALKAAGISSPIPGISDLVTEGSFFACPPYGTCWLPHIQPVGGDVFLRMPCLPGYAGVPPPLLLNAADFDASVDLRWTWAVCHAGSFIRRHGRYAWVVGHKHHRPPIRWVHIARFDGFVLAHPNDQKGKLPVNLKHGVFVPSTAPDKPTQQVDLKPSEKITPLTTPPKAYRSQPLPSLPSAGRPEIQAHYFAKPSNPKEVAAASIKYDYKRKAFVAVRQDSRGSVTRLVVVGGVITRGGSSANSRRSSGSTEGRGAGSGYSRSSTSRSMPSGSSASADRVGGTGSAGGGGVVHPH